MATGGDGVSPSSDKRESLTCSLCLDIFTNPRLLPCSHTYCQKCLDDLIQRHPGGTFPCPACRTDIQIPAEGASGFQANFYIDEDELDRARNDTMCSVHPQKKLDMFCGECDDLICMDCKMGDHLHHKTQSAQDAAENAKQQLCKDAKRIKHVADDIQKKTRELSIDHNEYTEKLASVERGIRHRHAQVVASADKFLNEALDSLNAACTETENTQSRNLRTAQNYLNVVSKLQQKMDTALQNGEGCTIVNTAKEMRTGCGSEENLAKMRIEPLQRVSRPIHVADTPQDDGMFVSMKKFIGTAQLISYDCSHAGVDVKEEIQCGEHDDSVVFCVCPGDDDGLLVSFEASYKDKEPCVKYISPESKAISDCENKKGPHSYRRIPEGGHLYLRDKQHDTFVKCASKKLYYLNTISDNEADVVVTNIITEKPYKSEPVRQFTIQCGPHRAVDVDSSDRLFAVVEEPVAVDGRRQVKLFQHSQRTAVDTYQAPVTDCQPADVCFFSLKQREVLLITDELNDAIHVVDVKDDRLTFSHYLAPGCPLLVKPTALNTGHKGRLWVGCRGGRLLTMTPLP